MLLYLTSNKNRSLIDGAAKETNLAVKKLVGKYVLRNFIVKEIRNFAAIKCLVVDVSCAEDSMEDFCIALQSFQMMFSAKVVVLLKDIKDKEAYTERLSAVGITNLITEETPEGVTAKLLGYVANKPEPKPIEETQKPLWQAKNVRIAVAGVQHRSGTTVTAMNLAFWLASNGASVCYVEDNTNRHLRIILRMYEAKAVKDHYTSGGIDFYYTDNLDRDYNFIIYDCGALSVMSDSFKTADKRLLCGAALPYELSQYKRVLSICGDLPLYKLVVGVPEDIKEHCSALIGSDIHYAEPSHTLFDEKVNESIYNEVTADYKQ